MDAADFVTREEQRLQQRFEAQRKAKAAKPTQQSATDCAECGAEIPQKRRELIPGVQRCTLCQELSEKRP